MVKSRSTSSSGSGNGKSCYRGHWRPAEDDKLRQLVEQFGPQNWNFIAEHFEGRSGKSCRLRWYNQLDPNINKNPFTEEEEERLLIYQQLHGNKWALIARHFKGRTDNAVKNHYHVIMARRRRERFTIFGNKSVHQNNIRNPHNLALPKFQNHEKKWSLFGASSAFTSWPSWDLSESNAAKDQKRRKDHMIIGGSSTSCTSEILNCKKNTTNVPFRVLNFGDGNGNRKMIKMSNSVTKSNDNPMLFMNWPVGSDQKEQGNGPISEQMGTLPFIDFLGMGSS